MSHFAYHRSSFQFLEKLHAATLKIIFIAKFNSVGIGEKKLCSALIAFGYFDILITIRMQVGLE